MKLHLFSAHANATFAAHGQASVDAQSAYHRALQAKYGEKLSIVYGVHTWNRQGTPMPVFEAGQPYQRINVSWFGKSKKSSLT